MTPDPKQPANEGGVPGHGLLSANRSSSLRADCAALDEQFVRNHDIVLFASSLRLPRSCEPIRHISCVTATRRGSDCTKK
jgi:hypothetical protein